MFFTLLVFLSRIIFFLKNCYFLIYSLICLNVKASKLLEIKAFSEKEKIDLSERCSFFLEKVNYSADWLDLWIKFYYFLSFKKEREIYINGKPYYKKLYNNNNLIFNNLKVTLEV